MITVLMDETSSPGETLPSWPEPTHTIEMNPVPPLRPAVTVYEVLFNIPEDAMDMDDRTLFPTPRGEWNPHVYFPRTIMAGGGSYDIHYLGHRAFTTRELACMQSFPVDYIFAGRGGEKRRQVGNAVPPALGLAVMREVVRHLKRCDATRKRRGFTDKNRRARSLINNYNVVDIEVPMEDHDEVLYLESPPSFGQVDLQSALATLSNELSEAQHCSEQHERASGDHDDIDWMGTDDNDSDVVEILEEDDLDDVEDLIQEVELIDLDDDPVAFIADEYGTEVRDPNADSVQSIFEPSQPAEHRRRRRRRRDRHSAVSPGIRTVEWGGQFHQVSHDISDEEFLELMQAAWDFDQLDEHEVRAAGPSGQEEQESFGIFADSSSREFGISCEGEPGARQQRSSDITFQTADESIVIPDSDGLSGESIEVIDSDTEDCSPRYSSKYNVSRAVDFGYSDMDAPPISFHQTERNPHLTQNPFGTFNTLHDEQPVIPASGPNSGSVYNMSFTGRSRSQTPIPSHGRTSPWTPRNLAFRPRNNPATLNYPTTSFYSSTRASPYQREGSLPSNAIDLSDDTSLQMTKETRTIYDEDDVSDGDDDDTRPLMCNRASAPRMTTSEPIELSDDEGDDEVVQTGVYYRRT